MTKETEEKLALSLTAETTELLPYLPYLLQDFWELGIDHAVITELIDKHTCLRENAKILDLACGKGAVSVRLAHKFRVKVKGIDLIGEFIEYAAQKAREFNVDDLCTFAVGDINEAVKKERNYDCVILGSVGDVLGGRAETLKKLKATVKPGGWLLFDNYDLSPVEQWEELFQEAGLELIETVLEDSRLSGGGDDSYQLVSDSGAGMAAMTARANELIEKYPDKRTIFEEYLRCQQKEYDELENQAAADNVTWILKKHTDTHSPKGRSYNMSQVHSKDTKPEVLVRKYLFSQGLRFKKNDKRYPGNPDIVLPKHKAAVFVNGCFWHKHSGCKHYTLPKTNTEFWDAKLENNRLRDERNYSRLRAEGWKVIVVWECELKTNLRDESLKKLRDEIREGYES